MYISKPQFFEKDNNSAAWCCDRASDSLSRSRSFHYPVSGTRKFDRGLSRLLLVDLHWLDGPERVQYKLGVTVRRCQQHKAPQYLTNNCVTSASDIASRQRLRSASRHQLLVLRYQLSSLGRRSFAIAGPTT